MATSAKDKAEALETLRALRLRPGQTVYTVLRHVSASGMYRRLDLYVMRKNEPRRITYHVARALGYRYDIKNEALGIGGCGMDMGFAVVYSLSRALFPKGFKRQNGEHGDGGYALSHRWM